MRRFIAKLGGGLAALEDTQLVATTHPLQLSPPDSNFTNFALALQLSRPQDAPDTTVVSLGDCCGLDWVVVVAVRAPFNQCSVRCFHLECPFALTVALLAGCFLCLIMQVPPRSDLLNTRNLSFLLSTAVVMVRPPLSIQFNVA